MEAFFLLRIVVKYETQVRHDVKKKKKKCTQGKCDPLPKGLHSSILTDAYTRYSFFECITIRGLCLTLDNKCL